MLCQIHVELLQSINFSIKQIETFIEHTEVTLLHRSYHINSDCYKVQWQLPCGPDKQKAFIDLKVFFMKL